VLVIAPLAFVRLDVLLNTFAEGDCLGIGNALGVGRGLPLRYRIDLL
jgi:hypothetical protein